MRLPEPSEIADDDQSCLYGHDLEELHALQVSPTSVKYLRRFGRVLKLIQNAAPNRILDVGCAQGNISIALSEMGDAVVACDLRRSFVKYARMKDDIGRTQYAVADAYALPFRPCSFDCIVATEIIEHLAFPERFLAECHRLLSPGGLLVVTTPNGANVLFTLPSFRSIKNRTALAEIECMPDADGHLFLFTPQELWNLLVDSGFVVSSLTLSGSSILSNRLRRIVTVLPRTLVLEADVFLSCLPGIRHSFCETLITAALKVQSGPRHAHEVH